MPNWIPKQNPEQPSESRILDVPETPRIMQDLKMAIKVELVKTRQTRLSFMIICNEPYAMRCPSCMHWTPGRDKEEKMLIIQPPRRVSDAKLSVDDSGQMLHSTLSRGLAFWIVILSQTHPPETFFPASLPPFGLQGSQLQQLLLR